MKVKDEAALWVHASQHLLNPGLQFLLRALAGRMPGCERDVTGTDHLKSAYIDDSAIRIAQEAPTCKHIVYEKSIVITCHHITLHTSAAQSLFGKGKPLFERLHHQSLKDHVKVILVASQALKFVLVTAVGIETVETDALLRLIQFIGVDRVAGAKVGEFVHIIRPCDDWHHRFARDIASHDEYLRTIESGGIKKLAKAFLGSVDIAAKK